MKFTASLASFALSIMLALPVQAKEVAGVQLAPSIIENDQVLELNGAGVRLMFFIDLYVAALYTKEPVTQAEPILSGKVPAAVRLNILSSLITTKKMIETVEEGFMRSTGGNLEPLRERLNKFMEVFAKSEIKKGDQFTLVSEPNTGIIAYRNGQKVTTVAGEDFRRALLGVWFGEEPASKGLKREMLGQ